MNHTVLRLFIALLVTQTLQDKPLQSKQGANRNMETGVQVIQAGDLDTLVASKQKLLVFFADKSCPNCELCSNAYAFVNQQHYQAAYFTKIYLSANNRPIFQQFGVNDFPRILAFIGGKLSPHQFQCLGTSSNMERQLIRWINRLDNSLREWGGEEDHQHQLIVHCDSQQLKKMWKKVQRTQLWLDLYCGNKQFLGDNIAVVCENGRSIQAWQYQTSNLTELEQKINRLIKAYKYKYVLTWNTAIAQQIFLHKQSAFLMIVNNQSRSLNAYEVFEAIKVDWYQNAGVYQPILFSVSELAKEPYETTRLKRYLTGIAGANRKVYYYPILAFIDQTERTRKFVMSPQMVKDQKHIERWIQSVHQHIILKKPYRQGEQKLYQWFNEDLDQKKGKDVDSDSDSDDDIEVEYVKTPEEWYKLMDKQNKKPFFVYFAWRYDYQMQKKETDVVLWWQDKNHKGISPYSQIPLIVHLLHSVDLPPFPDLQIQFLPSLAYVSPTKQVQILSGVTDMAKIKQMFNSKVPLLQTK